MKGNRKRTAKLKKKVKPKERRGKLNVGKANRGRKKHTKGKSKKKAKLGREERSPGEKKTLNTLIVGESEHKGENTPQSREKTNSERHN